MPIMTDRVFLLVSVHQGAVLGVHCHASDDFDDYFHLMHNEEDLCAWMQGLPDFDEDGMWCICAEAAPGAVAAFALAQRHRLPPPEPDGFERTTDSPAPEWRRPTLDEMIQIIEGRTPPPIVKWTRFEAWGE